MHSTAIVILAGGKSSRMRQPKQLLKINGDNLLDIIIEKALKIQKENIFCVLGANAEIIKPQLKKNGIIFLENQKYEEGLSSSIIHAVKYIESNKSIQRILFILGDQPEISRIYLEEMLAISNKNLDKIIATNYQKNYGVPAIFPRKYFKELKEIERDKGAKELLNKLNEFILLPNLIANSMDLDCPEDYENYLQSFKKNK